MHKSTLIIGLVMSLNWAHGQNNLYEKKWTKIEDAVHTFYVGSTKEATLKLVLNASDSKAILSMGALNYTFRKVGFWKNTLEIVDDKNGLIGKVYADKWYGNAHVLEYKGREYKIVTRNNPLSELAILQDNKLILAYGLDPGEAIRVKITSSATKQDYLLDALLWYMFWPIAAENMGNRYEFVNHLSD